MNDMQIGDFDKEDDISKSVYQDEVNSLKIDKLNNRVTIISIILPCLIGAVLFFAYLDIKERMVSVDSIQAKEVKQVSQKLDEKFNALDVKIAKINFKLDKKLPELENQITSTQGRLAKLDSTKAAKETMETRLAKMEKMISNNSNQYKGLLNTIERMNNQTLSIVNEIDDKLKKNMSKIEEKMNQKISNLPDYSEELAGIRDQIDGLDHRIDSLDNRIDGLDKRLAKIEDKSGDKSMIQKEIGKVEQQILSQIEKLDVKFDKKILEIKKRVEFMESKVSSFQENTIKKRDSDLMDKRAEPVTEKEESGSDDEIQEKNLTQ